MDMLIDFPGGSRVDAHYGAFTVHTDQPEGGAASAPTPFDLFLASLGTCAGFYVLSFCRSRNIPMTNIRLRQRDQVDPETHMLSHITIEIELPPDFPERYKSAVIRAAEQCKVKKHIEQPPKFEIVTVAST